MPNLVSFDDLVELIEDRVKLRILKNLIKDTSMLKSDLERVVDAMEIDLNITQENICLKEEEE